MSGRPDSKISRIVLDARLSVEGFWGGACMGIVIIMDEYRPQKGGKPGRGF